MRGDAVSAHANEIALAVGDEARARLEQLLSALRDDDFQSAISLLLEQNDTVMRARGGAGWFEHRGPTLRARFFAEPVDLPARKQLPKLWSHSYFLDSVRWLGADIETLAPRTADGN